MPYVNLRPNDQLLVVRGTNSYKTSVEALRTNSAVLQDNDQFLVQRGTNSYRISKLELQNEINTLPDDPPVVTSVVLAQDQFNANRFTGNSFTTTVTATNQPTQLNLRAEVVGALSESASTEPIDANTYNGSGGVPLELEGDANLGTKFKVGDVVQASATYTPTSSEITNVTQLSVEASDSVGVDWTPNINNPSYYAYGTNGADYYLYVKFNAAQTLRGNLRHRAGINAYQGGATLPGCTVNGLAVSTTNDPVDNAYWIYSTDGLTVNAGEFVTIRLPVSAPGTPFFYGFDPGVFVDSGVELECTDSTDLKLFQTGDVVGGGVGWGTELVYVNNSEGFDPSFPPVLAVDRNNDTYAGAKNKGVDTKMFIDLRRLTSGLGYQGEVSVYKAGSTGNYRWYCENTDGTVSAKTSSDNTIEWAVLNPGNTSKYVKTVIAESDEGYVTFIRGIALGSQASVLATSQEMGEDITGPVKVFNTDPDNNKITVDGGVWGPNVSVTKSNQAPDGTHTVNTSGKLTQLTVKGDNGGGRTYMRRITIDGVELVDGQGGVTFSSNTSVFPGTFDAGPQNIFDGDPNTRAQTSNNSATITISFPTPYDVTSSIVVVAEENYPSTITYTILQNGDTQVTTTSPKRGSGTIKSISGTDVEIQPFTDNCFKETQTLIKTGPIKITPITEPIKTINGNTIEFDGPEQLLNFANGDTVTMCNADGTPASVTYETSEIVGVTEFSTYLESAKLFSTPMSPDNPIDYFLDANTLTFTYGGGDAKIVVKGLNISGETSLKIYGNGGSSNPTTCYVCFNKGLSDEHTASYNTTQSSTWNTADIPSGMVVKSFEFYQSNNIVWVSAMAWSDEFDSNKFLRAADEIEGGALLTFANDTNLDKFPIGTVVGESSTVYSARCSTDGGSWWSNDYLPANAFTGADTTDPYCGGLPNKWIKIDFRGLNQNCDGLTVHGVTMDGLYAKVNGSDTLVPSDYTRINGGTPAAFVTQTWAESTSALGADDILDEIYFGPNTSNGNSFSWVKINGVYLKDGTVYTVTDNSDIANDKLTVSGGEWGGALAEKTYSDDTGGPPYSGYEAVYAFNGVLNDYNNGWYAGENSIIGWNPDPVIPCDKLTVIAVVSSSPAANCLSVNGGNIDLTPYASDGTTIYEIDIFLSSGEFTNLTHRRSGSSYMGIMGFKIDAKIVLDGPLNMDQVWSKSMTPASDWQDSAPETVFDGSLSSRTWWNGGGGVNSGDYTVIAFDSPVTASSSVRIYASAASGREATSYQVVLDEVIVNVPLSSSSAGWSADLGAGSLAGIRCLSQAGAIYAVEVDGALLADKGIGGETELSTSYSGVGTVSTVDATDNKIVLSNSNNQWMTDYHMTTTEKNKVEMTGYLSFNSSGGNVQLSRIPQDFTLMTDVTTPTITFPATFSTGNAPDTDLPNPTYLKTYVQAGNVRGFSAEASSNLLYPITTSSLNLPPPGVSRLMVEEFNEFCKMVGSCDYRSAEATIEEAVSQVSDLRERAEHVKTELEAN